MIDNAESAVHSLYVITFTQPGRPPVGIGICLADAKANRYEFVFRQDWDAVAVDEDNEEVVRELAREMTSRASAGGGGEMLTRMMEWSNAVQVTDAIPVPVIDWSKALEKLFRILIQGEGL